MEPKQHHYIQHLIGQPTEVQTNSSKDRADSAAAYTASSKGRVDSAEAHARPSKGRANFSDTRGNYQLQALTSDASPRRYHRLSYTTPTGTKSSLILMRDKNLQAYTGAPTQVPKMPFVYWQNILQQKGLHVPRIIDIQAQLQLMVLEDLGSTHLSDQSDLNNYHKAIDQLVALQSLKLNKAKVEACHPAFTADFFFNELRFALDHFVHQYCGLILNDSFDTKLQHELQQLCQSLAQQPQVLCHRDFHSRNLICHHNKVYMLDFQDARLGPPQYDLVSLLYDAYAQPAPELQNQLLTYYKQSLNKQASSQQVYGELSEAQQSSNKLSRQASCQQSLNKLNPYQQEADFLKAYILSPQFDECWDLQVLQRLFKACGSFASFYNLKGDDRYLKYLKPCTQWMLEKAQKTNFRHLTQVLDQVLQLRRIS